MSAMSDELGELLDEVAQLRAALAAEQGAHATTSANFADYAGYEDDPKGLYRLERAIELRRQAEATCVRRTAERDFAQRQLEALAALVNERALAEHGTVECWRCGSNLLPGDRCCGLRYEGPS